MHSALDLGKHRLLDPRLVCHRFLGQAPFLLNGTDSSAEVVNYRSSGPHCFPPGHVA
jgi:hypothetical protein